MLGVEDGPTLFRKCVIIILVEPLYVTLAEDLTTDVGSVDNLVIVRIKIFKTSLITNLR